MPYASAQSPTIRPAVLDDAAELLRLYDEFHAFHVQLLPDRLRLPSAPSDISSFAALIRPIIESADSVLLVAEGHDGRLAGCAEAYLHDDSTVDVRVVRRYAHLQSLMIDARLRRHGAGTQLLVATEAWAREQGAEEMRTDTWESAGGPLGFYERSGYRTLQRNLVKPLHEDG